MKLLARETDNCSKCVIQQLKENAPLISEALMYAEFHRNSATKEGIVRVMCGFFTDEEIKSAKAILYERYGKLNILKNAADRRTTGNRSDMMAICCDLVDDLFQLEEKDIKVTCCAINWKRVPNIAPEETNNISLAEQVAMLKSKFDLYDAALSEIRTENSVIERRVKDVESKCNYKSSANKTRWPKVVSGPKSDNVENQKSSTSVSSNDDKTTSNDVQVVISTPDTGPLSIPVAATALDNEQVERRHYERRDSWQLMRGSAKRHDRQKVNRDSGDNRRITYRRRGGIMGQATSGGLRPTTPPCRDFFVYRCNKDDGEEEMRNFLKSNGIDVKNVTKTNNPAAKMNSFKISVNVMDAQKMWNEDMWSTGVCVRKWRSYDTSQSKF